MKQLYLLLTVCLYCSLNTNAQTKYWIGSPGDNWNDAANWSDNPGGLPGADVPNGAGYNVIFNQAATVVVDIAHINLHSLSVTADGTTRLYTTAPSTIVLHSTNTAAPALLIAASSTLVDSAAAGSGDFIVRFANGAKGTINGNWYFTGLTGGTAYADFPATSGHGNLVEVTGTIKLVSTSGHIECNQPEYLYFGDGATYWVARNAGVIPRAGWHANSTILVTGSTTSLPSGIGLPPAGQGVGNFVFDCPGLTVSNTFQIPHGLVFYGDMRILNTNNTNIGLGATTGSAPVNFTVQGDFELSPNANVTLGGNSHSYNYNMQVNGSFIQTGGSFYLRNNTGTGLTLANTLSVAGNITQTAGTFGCLNTSVSTSIDLFVLELNGSANQTVAFSSNTIDNATNQVTLRVNNPNGATLTTPLSVGKISWSSANQGILTTTSTNVLTINNTDISDTRVVNSPSNTGYINGPVRRKTATNTAVSFPTGKGGVLRACEIIPTATTLSEYESEYFGTAHSTPTVQAPLTGISNQEYWNIGKLSGSDAVVRLTLAGAVPGAGPTDTLVVAHYNGTVWTDASGTELTPGNTSTGSVESAVLTTFSPFTFGFTSEAALPIHLLSFTARKEGGTAKLNWTITENSTPKRFEVLRSTNGSNFTQIGTVTGIERKLAYDFTDNALPNGTVYYRLRMIDIDETATLSKIVAVMNGSKGVVITSMMPTLVTSRARLNISSSEKGNIQLVVTDIYGRTVKQQVNSLTTGNQEIWLNLGTLPAGTYQVTGYLAAGEKTSSIRFIRQ